MMSVETKVWLRVLRDYCHCAPDSEGGVPCDYGAVCDRCMTKEVQSIYEMELKKERGEV